jgi:alkaline phosphatase
MSKRFSLLIIYACGILITFAQPKYYSPQNLHAHNDYEKPDPFRKAFNAGVGSIEADVFLIDGALLLAHSIGEVKKEKSLEAVYLKPIDSLISARKGKLSETAGYHLQLMIDIKSSAVPALEHLVTLLKRYPAIISSRYLTITISGNRPSPENYVDYPSWIFFDGLPDHNYTKAESDRIPMFSDNFKQYSSWKGEGPIPAADKEKLTRAITRVHGFGKTIRFWNAPDSPNAWQELTRLRVDWINTDRPAEAAAYLTGHP